MGRSGSPWPQHMLPSSEYLCVCVRVCVCVCRSCREMYSLLCTSGSDPGSTPMLRPLLAQSPSEGRSYRCPKPLLLLLCFFQSGPRDGRFIFISFLLLLVVFAWCILFKMSFFICLHSGGPRLFAGEWSSLPPLSSSSSSSTSSSACRAAHVTRAGAHTCTPMQTGRHMLTLSSHTPSHTCIKRLVFSISRPQYLHSLSLSLSLSLSHTHIHTHLCNSSPQRPPASPKPNSVLMCWCVWHTPSPLFSPLSSLSPSPSPISLFPHLPPGRLLSLWLYARTHAHTHTHKRANLRCQSRTRMLIFCVIKCWPRQSR